MTLPLNKEMLAASYDFLRTTPPFKGWRLPHSAELQFKVARDPHTAGWHTVSGRGNKKKHILAVSERCIGHSSSLIPLMAHEMIHLHQALSGEQTPGSEHNPSFYRYAKRVCRIHGFDPKAF